MTHPHIISVILNTNRRQDTLECLSSLAQSEYEKHSIIVLDNRSTDGSVEAIRSTYPEVEIIELSENLGYAGNNNVGIEAAMAHGADWVLVLNEDTILDPDCLKQLAMVGESDESIGIVGPMVYHHDEPDIIQSAGGILGRFWEPLHAGKDEIDKGQFVEPRKVDWISGCAIMLRRAVVEQVGMIDERYFYFNEELEWCLRAGEVGWRIIHVPNAKIWHKGVQRDYHPKPSLHYYSTRNQFLTLSKHNAPVLVKIGAWSRIVRTLTSWTVRPKWRHMRAHRNAMWLGMKDYLRRRWGQMPIENQNL